MDIQRTILLIIFGMSLVFLWDGWQRHQGRPSLLAPSAVEQKAPTPAAPAVAAPPAVAVPLVVEPPAPPEA